MIEPTIRDFLSEADLLALGRPAGQAVGLPGVAYGARFHELEQKKLFPRLWAAVGFASDVPEPGDAKPVDLAGWPLLMLRGQDGTLRMFHNVCRHRGNRLVVAPCRGLGHVRCSWHSWTYGLDGRLLQTPRLGGQRNNADPAFDTADVNLKPVRMAEWLDFVFVNIDGAGPPFEEHIRPLADLLAGYDFTDMRVGDAWDIAFPCNWKVVVEGAIEDYHLPFIHAQLVKGEVEARPRLDHAEAWFFANSSSRDYRDTKTSGEVTGLTSGLPPVLRDAPGIEPRTFVISVFPTGFMTTRTNYLWLWLILPTGSHGTRVDTRQYYKGGTATDPAFAEVRRNLVEEWRLVLEQDVPLARNVQASYDRPSDAGIRTRFSPYWESNVLHFQRSIVNAVLDP
ncbi:MAG: aromatic ring-hydroxylating oxygenase subunit alpha [Alphaproteobacteria bacterium]